MAGRKKTVSLPPKKPSPVTKDELARAIAPLATKTELHEAIAKAIAPLATKDELAKAIEPLATKAELEVWGTRLYDVIGERTAGLASRAELQQLGVDLRREVRLDMDEAFRGFRQEMQRDMAQLARSIGAEMRTYFGVIDDKYRSITADLDVRVTVLEDAK